MNLPPKSPPSWAPGVRNRYDDFSAAHINNTGLVHGNGVFLSWHRHFLHLFQTALTEECGYKAAIPYWNWPWWAEDLKGSPLFDGSKTSIGGDGYWDPDASAAVRGNRTFPRGQGGGCIKKGPFVNITTGFRYFEDSEFGAPSLAEDALDYVPHCVTRDLNTAISGPYHTPEIITSLLTAPTIADFQIVLDGVDKRGTDDLGPHGAGHWAIGLSLKDQFLSPSDPAFWLHHSMIDNLWAQWQLQDPETRTFALSGTVTTLNNPPSENATVDFVTQFGYLDGTRKLEELMASQGGMYCYRYDYDQNPTKPSK
jgi:tyrosinase